MTIFNNKTERGISTIAALLTLLSLAAMASIITYTATVGQIGKAERLLSAQALYVTQAGIEYGVKKIYEGLSEIVDPPGINFGDGNFTIQRAGNAIIVTGTVGDAVRVHQVDSPTEADCLTIIDIDNANFQKGGTRLTSITFRKDCLMTITIDKMQLWWVSEGPEAQLQSIKIQDVWIYSNPSGVPSGTLLETTDYVLTGNQNNVINQINFTNEVNDDEEITLSFIMGDGSIKTVTFTVNN